MSKKIEFQKIRSHDRSVFETYFPDEFERGSDFSFANLYLWGRQSFAVLYGHIVLFSQFERRSIYPFPIGKGDKKKVIDAILNDAKERGIPCRISGISEKAKELLESVYPSKFRFHTDEGTYDYVYRISDLAELKGKKYHGKRNHIHRFREICPDYRVLPITEDLIPAVRALSEEWYRSKKEMDPDGDFHSEEIALDRALRHISDLNLEGIALENKGEIIAFSLGSFLNDCTIDVHFEKAKSDINGAYTAVNYEFARYIRDKYPSVLYLDREEDMGIEGLRKAKKSYYPDHMIKKYWAYYLEDSDED